MKCLHPIFINIDAYGLPTERNVGVPCGKCEACLSSRSLDWQIRLLEEYKHCSSALFVTLTYDEDSVSRMWLSPDDERLKSYFGKVRVDISRDDSVGVPVVSREDIHLFLKRLRKDNPDSNIRYFICSEYGPKTLRPHYHGFIFNLPKAKAEDSEYIAKLWSYGFVDISPVTSGRIKYATKYCFGVIDMPDFLPKNFISTSRRPALGSSYIDNVFKQWEKFHDLSELHYHKDGKNLPLPRFYLRKLKQTLPLEVSIAAFLQYVNEEKWLDHDSIKESAERTERIDSGSWDWYETPSESETRRFLENFYKKYYKNRKL